MGKFNYKNYILHIKISENLTDPRFVEFVKKWDFTYHDVFRFQDTIEPLYNAAVEKILIFLITYKKMDLCPDYFNSFEPINKPFDKNDIFTPMHCVSFPAGTLFLRKKRKFDIVIENLWYGLIFDPQQGHKVIPSKKELGKYLGSIKIYISKHTQYPFLLYQTLINDFCTYLNTDYGIIYDQETGDILYQVHV